MAKRTSLQLLNVLLRKIKQGTVNSIVGLSGHSAAMLDCLNDAIIEIGSEARWHTLLTTRKWRTSFDTLITVLDYTALSGKSITITYKGVAAAIVEGVNFSAVTDNATTAQNISDAIDAAALYDGITGSVGIDASGNNIVTTRTAPIDNVGISAITTDAASTALTVATVAPTYFDTAADFDSEFMLKDLTNNRFLHPDWSKLLDAADPDESRTGTPEAYTIENDEYRLWPRPAQTNIIVEKYFKEVSTFSADTDVLLLPRFVEPVLNKLAEANAWYYLDKTEKGVVVYQSYKNLLEMAKERNEEVLDRLVQVDSTGGFTNTSTPLEAPSRGPNYPRTVV